MVLIRLPQDRLAANPYWTLTAVAGRCPHLKHVVLLDAPVSAHTLPPEVRSREMLRLTAGAHAGVFSSSYCLFWLFLAPPASPPPLFLSFFLSFFLLSVPYTVFSIQSKATLSSLLDVVAPANQALDNVQLDDPLTLNGAGPERLTTIFFTSGSTGPPKGVMCSVANFVK